MANVAEEEPKQTTSEEEEEVVEEVKEDKKEEKEPEEQEETGSKKEKKAKKDKKKKKEKKVKDKEKEEKEASEDEESPKNKKEAVIPSTSPKKIKKTVKKLRETFESNKTKPLIWRKEQLKNIIKLLEENEDVLAEALEKDLGRCKHEAYVAEYSTTLAEAKEAVSSLSKWMKPTGVSVPMLHMKGMSSAEIQYQPLGVVLIISPWNYPINLCLAPLIGAIAAGNCVVIKPSEVAAYCSNVLAELIPKYLDPSVVAVIEGAVPETTALLKEAWDHIFYTGNGTIGKIIMRAAAENLTPTTLELGGKSPCIVDAEVDLEVAAKRIAWGKFMNCGQTCIAPDYLLVHKEIAEAFIPLLKEKILEFYGEDPSESPDYGRIVSVNHVKRLAKLLEDVESDSILVGGDVKEDDRYIAPTLLVNIPKDAKVMEDEIFGPILPIYIVDNLDEAIRTINSKPRPLTLYLFSKDQHHAKLVLSRTVSGSACINETLMQFTISGLPFGGIGPSGMGAYHGKASFDTFSHKRSVLNKTTRFDADFRYPPYTTNKVNLMRKLV